MMTQEKGAGKPAPLSLIPSPSRLFPGENAVEFAKTFRGPWRSRGSSFVYGNEVAHILTHIDLTRTSDAGLWIRVVL